ncbi:phage tail tape measure protein [Clostridium perfringens]|nr:phage tail tape measure protein [Clostridium perfringens]MDM0595543.1 phage tail tape measure protein [Clostridium perfringens]MDU6896398.1 phage tail tape measure protein [Clostridium perfringens]MDU6933566.1 phage tail tape measure protein [Clostridium perfringens]
MFDLPALRVKVKADITEAEKGLKKLKDSGKKVADLGGKLTKSVTTVLGGIGIASLKAASDVSEMESKFNVVFKSLASEADGWATTYANAIGRSKYEIKEAISNQADLYQGMGFTADEAYELSKQVTTLGYDLASFNNVNDAQAIDAMTKALMGETESAKMLGVNLTDTIMETSEFTKATGKSWKELSMAEKAQVRYQEAVKQSQNAMGDAERTSDGFTNQMKRLKGNFYDLGVQIGNVFLPIANTVVTEFNKMLSGVTKLISENPKLAQTIAGIGTTLAIIPPLIWAIGKGMVLFASAPALFAGLAAGIAVAGVAFLGLNENAQSTLDNLTYKISEFCGNFVQRITETAPELLRQGSLMISQFVQGLTEGIPILLETAFTIVKLLITTFMNTFPTIINTGFQLILQLVNGIVSAIPNLATTILNMGLDMLIWFLSNLPQWFDSGIQVLTNIIRGIVQTIPNIVQAVFDTGTQMLDTLIKRMPEFLQKGKDTIIKIIEGLKERLPSLLDTMGQAIMKTLSKIAERMPEFLQKGIQFVTEMIKGIGQNLPAIMGKMGELLGELIAKIIQYLPQFLSKGVEIVAKIIVGLIQGIPQLLSAGVDLAEGILDGIGSMMSGFLSIGSKIVSNIKQGVMNAWGNFTGWLSNKVKSIPIIGSLFSLDSPEGDGNGLTPTITPNPMANLTRNGLSSVPSMFGFMPKNKGIESGDFKKNVDPLISKLSELMKAMDNKGGLNLTIENFYNNTDKDIESLAEELASLYNQRLAYR